MVACERSGLTEQEREELTERVVKGSFSPEDLAIQEELERDSARPSVEGPPPPKPVVVAEVKPSRRAVKRVSPEPIEGVDLVPLAGEELEGFEEHQ